MPLYKACVMVGVVFVAKDDEDAKCRSGGALAEELRMNGPVSTPDVSRILTLADVPSGWADSLPWYGGTNDTVKRLLETGASANPTFGKGR